MEEARERMGSKKVKEGKGETGREGKREKEVKLGECRRTMLGE